MLSNEQKYTSCYNQSSAANTNEVRVQTCCTFLPRHSTDTTYHISSIFPKCHPTCFSGWYKSPLSFTKESGFYLGVCRYVRRDNMNVCVSARQRGKIKAAVEAWPQRFKILTHLLYLPCWQFLSGNLVQTVPSFEKITLGFVVIDLLYVFETQLFLLIKCKQGW